MSNANQDGPEDPHRMWEPGWDLKTLVCICLQWLLDIGRTFRWKLLKIYLQYLTVYFTMICCVLQVWASSIMSFPISPYRGKSLDGFHSGTGRKTSTQSSCETHEGGQRPFTAAGQFLLVPLPEIVQIATSEISCRPTNGTNVSVVRATHLPAGKDCAIGDQRTSHRSTSTPSWACTPQHT